MGKHEKKSKKNKKHKKSRRRSSSSVSSSNDEWVEKESSSSNIIDIHKKETTVEREREEWMSLPTLFNSSSSTDRRKERELAKQKEKESATYDPSKSIRELNPYWKQGGDGLPSLSQIKSKFMKPDSKESNYKPSYKSKSSRPSWRKRSPERSSHREPEPEPSTSKSLTQSRKYETSIEIAEPETEISAYLTDKEMNELAAKIVKAEILGQNNKVEEFKKKLERAREYRKTHPNVENNEESVILYRTNSKGYSKPLNAPDIKENQKRKKIETHDAGKRQKYFPDDDKYNLKQMFESEKFGTTHQDEEFVKLTAKVSKMDDMDDMFVDKIRNQKSTEKSIQKEKDKAIAEHHRMTEALNNCKQCLQSSSMDKHLMICLGENIYLSVPPHEPLTDGHCLLIPTRHVSCSTQLDENEWSEITDFRKALTKMFLSNNEDVIFYETVYNTHSYSHMVINCVPVPKEQGDLAPIYFKKAIDECETEWTTNKKLINLAGKDVRRAVPKGLPYFFVSFGMSEGFAHVIEDQRYFPKYFAAEIIGGILDLHHSKWRKPRFEKFDEQKSRVLQFSDQWKSFDCISKH